MANSINSINPLNPIINNISTILNTPKPFNHIGIYSSISDCDLFSNGIWNVKKRNSGGGTSTTYYYCAHKKNQVWSGTQNCHKE